MKKLICVGLLLCLLLCSLTACFEKDDSATNKNEPSEDQLAVINTAFASPGSHFSLQITTKTGDISLNALCDIQKQQTYAGTYIDISYQFEQLNPIEIDESGTITVPQSDKSVYSGTARIQNGVLVQVNGAEVSFPLPLVNVMGIRFTADNLSESRFENNTLTAKIKSPSAFFNAEIDATDMSVTLTLSETVVQQMTVNYRTADDTEVTLVYSAVQ